MKTLLVAAIALGLLLIGCTSQPQAPQPVPNQTPPANYSQPPPIVVENETQLPPEEIPVPPAGNGTNQTPPQPREPGKLGEFCGGIAAFQCEDNLTCILEGAYPDAGGTCQPEGNYGSEGDTCGGSSKPCAPGLQCITSGGIGTCTVPVASEEFHICPTERGEYCTKEYRPVCGRLVGSTPDVAGYREYGNGCEACSKSSNAIGYYEGTCDGRGK